MKLTECKIQNLKTIRLLTMMGIAVIALFIITVFPTQNKQVEKEDFVLDTKYCEVLPSMYVVSYIETPDIQYQDMGETVDDMDETVEEEPTFTDYDLYCLAVAICREAGGESEKIQLLVANVVMNRVESPYYPNTVHKVLTQYRQYGMMWKNGIYFPDWAREKDIEQCFKVARRILEGERVCPSDVLYQAEFIQGKIYKQYEGFYFCYHSSKN